MSSIVAARYADFLKSEGYKLTHDQDADVIRLAFNGETLDLQCVVYVSDSFIAFHVIVPLTIKPDKMSSAFALCNQLNQMRPIGNFEVQKISNKILFKIGMETPPEPSNEYFERTLMLALSNANSEAKTILKELS
ncbi:MULTISPECIES: YbjN domain-containing protein [unclassified Variovorax]|uniref:YbjN domain-containing protein n=1 Tax=unclassified Variovorax TaxID=663243 RepID=UPI003F478B32